MATTVDAGLSAHEQSIEHALRRIYDIPDTKVRQDELQTTVTHLAKDHPYPLAALLYKLGHQDNEQSNWAQQLLYKLLNDRKLEPVWRKNIQDLQHKHSSNAKKLLQQIQANKKELPPAFASFAALQAHLRSQAITSFQQHAESALAAYDNDEIPQACHHLAVAEQHHMTPESSCLHDHWHYLLDGNVKHLCGVIQYCLEQEPLNLPAIKLLLLQHYQSRDLNHCIATAAELTRLQADYAFLALPAVVALQQGQTDRAYEIIYNILEHCVDQPIKEHRHVVPALVHWVSYLPWTHRKKSAGRSDRKHLRRSQKKEHKGIPRSMLWRVMALLAMCHCQQALALEDLEEQLELLQRAQTLLRDISPYAWHHAPMLKLQKRLKKYCQRLERQKNIGPKLLASQNILQQRLQEASQCLFSDSLLAIETEQLLHSHEVEHQLQNCLHDFTLALEELTQSDVFWAQVTAYYVKSLQLMTV